MMQSIFQELISAEDQGRQPQFRLRSTVKLGRQQGIVVGVDHGNDAIKLAVLADDGTLITKRVPTSYREAVLIRGGANEVSYRVGNGVSFWMGDTSLRYDGDDLPIGPTTQRLVDVRLRQLIAAALCELLNEAGYMPGDYQIVLGFAVPNTEIVPIRGEGGTDKLGVDPETRAVLETHLKGAQWPVERIDIDGNSSAWHFSILSVLPQAQTSGTLIAFTKAPNGATQTDVSRLVIIDIGGGDLQKTTVNVKPYSMITERLGDGTIRIARALKDKFPRQQLNDVAAQQALITRTLLVSGKVRSIESEVQSVLNSQGLAIVGTVLPVLRQDRSFVVITGGGVILLHDLLQARLKAEDKVRGEDYELINHSIASVINAIGVMFGVMFAVKQRG